MTLKKQNFAEGQKKDELQITYGSNRCLFRGVEHN